MPVGTLNYIVILFLFLAISCFEFPQFLPTFKLLCLLKTSGSDLKIVNVILKKINKPWFVFVVCYIVVVSFNNVERRTL